MLGNVAIETLVGAFPLIGDLFDVVFKANSGTSRSSATRSSATRRPAIPRACSASPRS